MPHSFGYRARTRDLFCKGFRKKGTIALGRYLTTFKIGDLVDIKADGAVHKGMPHKFYHGKTGVVWNITKRAVGVEVNKLVGNRIMKKRIHVRMEHLKHSTCRKEFLDRVAQNKRIAALAKEKKVQVNLKREAALQPKGQQVIGVKSTNNAVETLYPEAYINLFV
mmetsp:Transcript_27206/g.66188  ORF Transcript_27206/g.66188 Transcript_27206/m.66188 type:complete len:165 (+) Transcript_27206:358-852(+)|eukprot:CAMPEP_0114496984 /NCGR_PEP_ID=MMETSP0109-20121206/6067_1 /TAXON_ID=29199 /ORGANISM="Chlorarachnion reptans, Strain CCCM449" /LENGTH=164 /DNA_ID=CAMNT_0001674305 /DNA_START=350 /DNA_END=844 /DNA_ORIENTATION=+